MEGDAQAIYDEISCARGEMENRIKEQQRGLFAYRTSCQGWWANQFRLLLSSAAYVLLETIRRVGLRGTELAHAAPSGSNPEDLHGYRGNTRRIRLFFSSAHPLQNLFRTLLARLSSA